MKSLMIAVVLFLFATPCYAQWERYDPGSRSSYLHESRYDTNPPRLYSGGRYIGELSADKYAPDSISNPYGNYGSKYSNDSINNKYGPYGKYRTQPIYIFRPYW